MRTEAQITVIIASVGHVAIFQNMDKTSGVCCTLFELTFCYECVNNVLVMRNMSEVMEPISEPMEILQPRRLYF